MAIEVARIPVLNDNYVWLMHDDDSDETVVIDPAVAEPVLAEADARGWTITQIWNTHWHPDHVGGNAEIKLATRCLVTGPKEEADRIPTLDRTVGEGDEVFIGKHKAAVLDLPAHTAGHIGYWIEQDGIVFVGDTLFAMGCGKLFEGTAEQMHANMQKLAALPDDTIVYCAHEYTESNGRFALTAEPENRDIVERMEQVLSDRAKELPTVPTTIAQEKATNPFMRAESAKVLGELRSAKDNFAG